MTPVIMPLAGRRVDVARARAAGGSGFGASLRSALRGATEPAAIDAPLPPSVTAVSPRDEGRDRAARENAAALLDELAALQVDLLRNGLPAARLQRLAMLATRMMPDDTELVGICTAIALRARVEAARLERSSARSRGHTRDVSQYGAS